MSIGLAPITSVEQVFVWVDASGTVRTFGGATGYDVLAAMSGRWFPPATWIEDRAVGLPGTVLRDVDVGSLDFSLPLLVTGSSVAQLHQRLRDLMYWFDPRRGDCFLRVTAPDASTRQIRVRVRMVDVREDRSYRGETWQIVDADLHAPEAYWEATAPIVQTFTRNFGTPVPFLNPLGFFPLNLTSTALFASPLIENPGTEESWPTWTFVGPGTNPSIRNIDTGEVMTFSRTLGQGEQLIVALDRASVDVSDGLGTPLFSTMSNPSVAWPIRAGQQRVQIGMSDATSASSLALAYTPKYLGP